MTKQTTLPQFLKTVNNMTNQDLQMYQSPIKIRSEVTPRSVFRHTTDFKAGNNHFYLLAIDDISLIPANDGVGKKINDLLTRHKNYWKDLQSKLVSIVVKMPDNERKLFNLDFYSFCSIFINPDNIIKNIKSLSAELANTWNHRNSSKAKRYARRQSHQVMVLDCRNAKTKRSKPIELAMAGTTWNYNSDVQSLDENCTCLPENVFFQLRFQYSDSQAISGMLSLKQQDWIDFLKHPQLHEFCLKLLEVYPLPIDYYDRISNYFDSNKSQVNVKEEEDDTSGIFLFKQIDTSDSEDSSEDSPPEKKQKINNN